MTTHSNSGSPPTGPTPVSPPGSRHARGAAPSYHPEATSWPESPLARLWADGRSRVGGVPFVTVGPREAADQLVDAAVQGGAGEHVHLANAYSIALADKFPALAAETFLNGGWNLPDGRPVSWISQLRGDERAIAQVRGPQFFLDVCEAGVTRGLRHYLLGGRPEVLERLQQNLRESFPGIEIVGADAPPFREPSHDDLQRRDDGIVASGAQIVWVGLGTPKQDLEVARIARELPVVAVAVGAGFDFAAGTMREAPRWIGRIGFEWAFRLAMEPRRLWRRYLFGNLRFLYAVMRRPRA